jgi:hypothetical protein
VGDRHPQHGDYLAERIEVVGRMGRHGCPSHRCFREPGLAVAALSLGTVEVIGAVLFQLALEPRRRRFGRLPSA